ncbi:amylo-alpha-1,6-glucosidase [Ramlibacter sp. AN1015]|uniref:amylo-alpha-1,6-glucosidase n=1 Tax=Ramlibacter sp. AN1015 TaxID=3133428 RepID=UPI0030C27989
MSPNVPISKDPHTETSTTAAGDDVLTREWLVTNGLGGYASGSVAGACTRRYHGLLVAALGAPLGRTLMLDHLEEMLCLDDGTTLRLGAEETDGALRLPDAQPGFSLEDGLPVWRLRAGGRLVEKRVFMPHRENTVYVSYRLLEGAGATLLLRPSLHMRRHEDTVGSVPEGEYVLEADGPRHELRSRSRPELPPLRLFLHGCASTLVPAQSVRTFLYRVEAARGYAHMGEVWSPGALRLALAPGEHCTLVASTEPWERMLAQTPQQALHAERERRAGLLAQAHPAARTGAAARLVLAADQFVISPSTRRQEKPEARTVIAGYHWFTDWGRDTMISLEGLTLVTGRHAEAGWILRTFLQHVRDGLIPNLFPEGENEGLYHTADATLWLFHAIDRYQAATGDQALLRDALPTLRSIIEHHLRGTRFGIGVDPDDGLLRQGEAGYQLTWMDAKVDGWVVTPRRGKAVELNALFHNALRLMQGWLLEQGDANGAQAMHAHAERLARSFNRRFWNSATGCLFDVVDGEQGDDAAIRPNMLLSIALPHPVLDRARWAPVLEVARRDLLTPVGLRSLAPAHPDYQARYDGDLRARDAAYHQGTVWAWLAGPFVDAWLRLHPQDHGVPQRLLAGLVEHLEDAGVGSISEVFDAEAPFTPRGCIAQAWSVAEALRIAVRLAQPPRSAPHDNDHDAPPAQGSPR